MSENSCCENIKTHKLLAALSPIVCFVYIIVTSLAGGVIEAHAPSAIGFFLHNLVAIALTSFAVFISLLIVKKYSSEVKIDFNLEEREKRVLWGLIFLMPLIFMFCHYASYLTLIKVMGEDYSATIYSISEFKEDMRASFHAIIIAPILEEVCFRIIPISLCQTKFGKFLMLLITAILFGFCHGKNFWMTFLDGIIFGMVFIYTKRPIISIICHMAYNLFSFVVGIAAFGGFATIYTCSGRPTLVVFDLIPEILICLVFMVFLVLCYMERKYTSR